MLCFGLCHTCTTRLSFFTMSTTYDKQLMPLIALLLCSKSSLMPKKASPGAPIQRAAKSSATRVTVFCLGLVSLGPTLSIRNSWPTKQRSNASGASLALWAKLSSTWCTFRPGYSSCVAACISCRLCCRCGQETFCRFTYSAHASSALTKTRCQFGLAMWLRVPGHCDPLLFAALETFRGARALGVDFCVVQALNAGPFGDADPQDLLPKIASSWLWAWTQWDRPWPNWGVPCLAVSFRGASLSIATGLGVHHGGPCAASSFFPWLSVGRCRSYSCCLFEVWPFWRSAAEASATLTNEHAQYWSQDRSSLCAKCSALDSIYHRMWECPATQALRDQLPVDFLCTVDSLPPVLREHGWTVRPSLADAWLKYLDRIPGQVQFPPLSWLAPILDVFTDGSCMSVSCGQRPPHGVLVGHLGASICPGLWPPRLLCCGSPTSCWLASIGISCWVVCYCDSHALCFGSSATPSYLDWSTARVQLMPLSCPWWCPLMPNTAIFFGPCSSLPSKSVLDVLTHWRSLRTRPCRPVTMTWSAGWSPEMTSPTKPPSRPTRLGRQKFGLFGITWPNNFVPSVRKQTWFEHISSLLQNCGRTSL